MNDDSDWNYEDDAAWTDRVGPHFKDDIWTMVQRHGYPCEYVGVPFIKIDYRALEKDQYDYYLYWRDCFWNGEMLRTCEGYLWLLANEIGMTDHDPLKTYLLLMDLWNKRKTDLFDPSLFTEFVRDYAIEHNLPQPTEDVFFTDRNEVLVNTIVCSPPWNLDVIMLREMTDGIGIMKDESDTVCKIVDLSLRRLNRILKRNGRDLLWTFSSSRLECVHDLYSSYELLKGRKVSVDAPDLFHEQDFRVTVRNMARYASSLVRGLREEDRPKDLSDVIIEIIKDTFENLDSSEPEFKPEEAVTLVRPVTGRYVARGLHSGSHDPGRHFEGERMNLMIDRYPRVSTSCASIVKHWKVRSYDPARYVPSGYVNPSYESFSAEQLSYYLFWRTSFMEGRYLETDNGYIRLLVAEIITCYDDPREAIGVLRRIREVYDDPTISKAIPVTIAEYSLVHGMLVDDVEGAYESLLNGVACLHMSIQPMADMPLKVLVSISGIDSATISGLDKETVKAINMSLRRIDKERVALGLPQTMELFNVKTIAHSAFYTLKRDFPMPADVGTFQTFVVKRNSLFRSYIFNTIKLVLAYVSKIHGKNVKIKIPKYHGERTLKIIEASVFEAFGLDPKGRKEVKLDKDALKGARQDLEAVTEMMSTETEEEPEEEKEEEKPEGWDALVSMFDDSQIEYLKEALEDGKRCASIAKSSGRTVIKMEDSINSLAMDTVGDTIVENQSVVEDYYDEVRDMLDNN